VPGLYSWISNLQNYIKKLITRLDLLNQQRIERSLAVMDSQAQHIFSVLPLLLHYNHSSLPGYLDEQTPYGVFDFSPSTTQHHVLHSFSQHTFSEPSEPAILGLYSMGSTSSIGQTANSDVDIWVCVPAKMEKESREQLEKKCDQVTEWAMQHGVEANFFLIDENRFRNNHSEEMTGDNCGSTQHLLLLDEFYRSAVRLAGRRLLWSIVPPEMEECYDKYVDQLCQDGQICCTHWIDFGKLNSIPAEEYFGSSLWQLYKSIDSPYKSVLKAILLEAYSWEYPNTQLLSLDSKRRFFAEEPNLYSMDSYYLMLEKVTRYLERINDYPRLELVRKSFYLKTHEKLSCDEPRAGSVEWRRVALTELTEQWGWSAETIEELDNRRNWKVEQVKRAHNELLSALMQSYRNLIGFARKNNITSAISPEDISILARKLYASFEELPGKVTLLNPQISPDLHEPDLSFIEVPENRTNAAGWYLYNTSLEAKQIIGQPVLEHNKYLSKLVAWAFFNGLLTESTRLNAVVKTADLNLDKFYQMVSDLRNTFSLRKPHPTLKELSNPCEIRQLSMFINLESDPTTELNEKRAKAGKSNFTDTDALSFGRDNKCLVGSVDLVYKNSWHEVRTMHFSGENATLEALKAVLGKMHQDALAPESVDVFCYSENKRGLIRNSIYQLLAECIEYRLKPVDEETQRRFKTIKIGNQMFGLFFERRGVSVQKLEDSVDFYRSISAHKRNGSPVLMLDQDPDVHPPQIVDANASEGIIQFFFEECGNGVNIYVLDEHNEVEVYRQFNGDKDEMVNGVNRYYTSTQDEINCGDMVNFNLPQFYDIVTPTSGESYVVSYRSGQQVNRATETPAENLAS
jgi:adenylate cyclase class 1